MTKIIVTSDTHGKHRLLDIPKCDIFIHAGDTEICSGIELLEFDNWMSTIPAKHKIWIAGNHDFYLHGIDRDLVNFQIENSIYLEDNLIIVEGLRIYGTPWTPKFGNWAFMENDKGLKEYANLIPDNLDILISHGPPLGILDEVVFNGKKVGSKPLLNRIKKVQPKICVFGHIHESYGKYNDSKTDYYNVSFLDEMYKPVNNIVEVQIG